MGIINVLTQSMDTGQGTLQTQLYVWSQLSTFTITTTFYVLRGFNATTRLYERWVAISPSAGPPSGASLQNITVEGTWSVQN